MIPYEIERLIYQCVLGGGIVVIASDDELASERFEELRKAVIVASDELRAIMDETEQNISRGLSDYEPKGISVELLEQIQAIQIGAEIEKEWAERLRLFSKCFTQALRNNYRKLHALPLKRRPRCRWRPRESRRSLDGLSPQIVIVDELNEWR